MRDKLGVFTDIGAVFVFIMAIGTGLDITARFFFNSPWGGTYEVTQILLLAIAVTGIVSATAADKHLSVDIIYAKLSSSGQRILDFVAAAFGGVFFVLLSWEGLDEFLRSWEIKEKTDMVGFPVYPFRLLLVIAFCVCAMIMLCEIARLLRGKDRGSSTAEECPEKLI